MVLGLVYIRADLKNGDKSDDEPDRSHLTLVHVLLEWCLQFFTIPMFESCDDRLQLLVSGAASG
jgi:hypothetical protein